VRRLKPLRWPRRNQPPIDGSVIHDPEIFLNCLLKLSMKTHLFPAFMISCAAALFAPLSQAESPIKASDGVMATTAGRTIYTFDNDVAGSGKSVCNGPCAALWPPVVASADAKPEGELTVLTRDDVASQWSYKVKPIYLYAPDTKAGDRSGDNFKNVWHVIRP
jgi:predicted lipoprotein with Yx(FWY)xxD motif